MQAPAGKQNRNCSQWTARESRLALWWLASAGLGSLLAVGWSAAFALSQAPADMQSDQKANEQRQRIEHGKYLTMHVAMCVECHSPHSREGVLNQERLFEGAPIPVKSPFAGQTWAFTAPKIAGLPGGYSHNDLATLLATGRRPDGSMPLAPMPAFRMNRDDAEAIAAYLESL